MNTEYRSIEYYRIRCSGLSHRYEMRTWSLCSVSTDGKSAPAFPWCCFIHRVVSAFHPSRSTGMSQIVQLFR